MQNNKSNDKLDMLDMAIANLKKYMRGGKGFINSEVVLNYLADKDNCQLTLADAIDYVYKESIDTTLGSARANDIVHWMGKRFYNAKMFMDSDCPTRSKTGFKKGIGYKCTYADILACSEEQIKRFRCMGDSTFEVFRSWFETKGYKLFTQDELCALEGINFNFYGESRSLKVLHNLGIRPTTLAKIEKNKMIWTPGITVIIDQSNISQHLQRNNAKKISNNLKFNMRTIEQNNQFTASALELTMVPEKFAKYVAIGMGEEVKQSINNERIVANSERLIRQRITHNPLETVRQSPRINTVKSKENVERHNSIQDMFDVLTENPDNLYNMDPGWIRALGEMMYDYIMRSDFSVKQKLEMIDYVKQVHNGDLSV